jgi:hypothetical protein
VPERNGNHHVGAAAKSVAEHASTLTKLEIELAQLELKKKAVSLGMGVGLGAGAGIFALFGLGFLFATIAAVLATFLDTWLALLIVTLLLFVTAGVAGAMALGKFQRGTPPVPEKAIREAKLTTEAIKR